MNEIKEQNELKDKEINILHKQIDKLTNKLQIQNINNFLKQYIKSNSE